MRKLVTFALLLLLPFAAAQSSSSASAAAIAELPPCALNCLLTAVGQSPCALTNQTCICTNQPLQDSVTACVAQNCTIKEGLSTKNITMTACGAPIRDRSAMFDRVAITLGCLSAATVVARFIAKIFITRADPGLDDLFIVLTLVCGVPSTIMSVRGLTANGLGKDVWTVPFGRITKFVHFFYFMEVLYFLQVALLKLSLLFFFQRIFPAKPVQRLLWGTIAFDLLYGAAFFFSAVFQCQPIDFYWNRWDGEHVGRCLNINALGWTNAALSIILDVWMLAVPLFQLAHLQLHWKKKIGVGIMFCVATFVTVVSILRLQSLVSFASSLNPTWDQLQVTLWSVIEINVGIMCACMPAIRIILVRIFPRILGTTAHSYNQYYGSNSAEGKLRSRSRSRSRLSQNHLGLQKPLPAPPPENNKAATMYIKGYNVGYEENDEARLVPMHNLDHTSGRAKNHVDINP